jgi:hypothetical protein
MTVVFGGVVSRCVSEKERERSLGAVSRELEAEAGGRRKQASKRRGRLGYHVCDFANNVRQTRRGRNKKKGSPAINYFLFPRIVLGGHFDGEDFQQYQGVQPTRRLRKRVEHLVWRCEKESDVA